LLRIKPRQPENGFQAAFFALWQVALNGFSFAEAHKPAFRLPETFAKPQRQPETKFVGAKTVLVVLRLIGVMGFTFAPYRGAGDLLSLLRQRK